MAESNKQGREVWKYWDKATHRICWQKEKYGITPALQVILLKEKRNFPLCNVQRDGSPSKLESQKFFEYTLFYT